MKIVNCKLKIKKNLASKIINYLLFPVFQYTKKPNYLLNTSGFSMILVVGLSAIIMLSIASLSKIITSSYTLASEITGSNYAYFAAEGAMERSLYEVSDLKPGAKKEENLTTFNNNSSGSYEINGVTQEKVEKTIKTNSSFNLSLYCDSCSQKYIQSGDFANFFCEITESNFTKDEDYIRFQFVGKNKNDAKKSHVLSGYIKGGDNSKEISIDKESVHDDIYDNINGSANKKNSISGFLSDNDINPVFFSAELVLDPKDVVKCTFEVNSNFELSNINTKITVEGKAGKFLETLKTTIPYLPFSNSFYSVSLANPFD